MRRVGLRRPRAGLLGRPLRGRRGARRRRLRAAPSASCSSATASTAGRSAPTWSARRCATRSTRATRACCREDVWGDGDPEGVRQRAAEKMKDTARAAARLGVRVVTGFTGSPIWHMLYSFPPNDWEAVERGYEEFAERWNPIIDVFDAGGRALRARGSPDRDRLRLPHHAQDARRDRPPRGLRDQLRSLALRPPVPRLGRRSSRSSPTASTTCTSRTRSSGSTAAARSSARTSTSASPSAAGRSSRPGHGDVDFEDAVPGAQPDRLRRPAVDRVGGLGHGPRLGRARRARVRAQHRLRPVVGGLRRRLCQES